MDALIQTSLFEAGLSTGVISILGYIVYYIVKKQNEREAKILDRSADREDKLMKFVLEMQPVQEKIFALIKDFDDRLAEIEEKLSPRKKW